MINRESTVTLFRVAIFFRGNEPRAAPYGLRHTHTHIYNVYYLLTGGREEERRRRRREKRNRRSRA